MSESIKYFRYQGSVTSTSKISNHYNDVKYPDTCPICHNGIQPELHYSIQYKSALHVAMRCPLSECGRMFITIYMGGLLKETYPIIFNDKKFQGEVEEISPSFIEIYNESLQAESLNLKQICGVGYRKALEFLIKDFLIIVQPENEDKIRKKFLGNCIKDHIENINLKQIAERAVWLGNDETHYERVWEEKDIEDLKKLIDVTLHWVSMEILTKKYIEDMQR